MSDIQENPPEHVFSGISVKKNAKIVLSRTKRFLGFYITSLRGWLFSQKTLNIHLQVLRTYLHTFFLQNKLKECDKSIIGVVLNFILVGRCCAYPKSLKPDTYFCMHKVRIYLFATFIIHLVAPQILRTPSFLVSPGYYSRPKINWKPSISLILGCKKGVLWAMQQWQIYLYQNFFILHTIYT